MCWAGHWAVKGRRLLRRGCLPVLASDVGDERVTSDRLNHDIALGSGHGAGAAGHNAADLTVFSAAATSDEKSIPSCPHQPVSLELLSQEASIVRVATWTLSTTTVCF